RADALRPAPVSAGQYPDQDRLDEHGDLPRGAGAVPGQRGRRSRAVDPIAAEAAWRGAQMDPEEGVCGPAAADDPAARQGGLQHADEELAERRLELAHARAAVS